MVGTFDVIVWVPAYWGIRKLSPRVLPAYWGIRKLSPRVLPAYWGINKKVVAESVASVLGYKEVVA